MLIHLIYKQRSHPDLDVVTHGFTFWDLDREFATGGFGGKKFMPLRKILGILTRFLLPFSWR
jgi:2-oxoglutarate dehydrogenase E1 component